MPNVAILGTEGCGKTVLITVMAKAFGRTNPHNIFLNPRTGHTAQYVERMWGYIARGEWPPSTPQGELAALHWHLRVPECADCELKIFDVAGQDLRRLFGQEQVQDMSSLPGPLRSLAEYVFSCQVVVFLVNLGDFVGEGDSARRLENQWALKYALDVLRATNPTRQCAVVFTQADLYRSLATSHNGWRGAAETYLPYLYDGHLRDGAVPVHAVSAVTTTDVVVEEGVARRVPSRRFQCKGLTPLATWIGRCASQLPHSTPQATDISSSADEDPALMRSSSSSGVLTLMGIVFAACLIWGVLPALWGSSKPTKPDPLVVGDWKKHDEWLDDWVRAYGRISNNGATGNIRLTVTVIENGRAVESQTYVFAISAGETQSFDWPLYGVTNVKNDIDVRCVAEAE